MIHAAQTRSTDYSTTCLHMELSADWGLGTTRQNPQTPQDAAESLRFLQDVSPVHTP